MYIILEYDGFRYFIFECSVESPDSLLGAVAVRLNFFKKYKDGAEIRFVVTSFLLPNGQIVPAVQSLEHLPLLQEVIDALEVHFG